MTWTTKELEENINTWYFYYILELLHYCKKKTLNKNEYYQKLKELEKKYAEELMLIGSFSNFHSKWATLVFRAETKSENYEKSKVKGENKWN